MSAMATYKDKRMFGSRYGRLTAIVINLFGTILTIYLLMQFDTVLYALMIILFSLSVSATQCRRRLAITVPVLVINLCVVFIGLPASLYLFYDALRSVNPDMSQWAEPITFMLYSIICFMNAFIIRNLHFHQAENQA
jgi:hypothetical protein